MSHLSCLVLLRNVPGQSVSASGLPEDGEWNTFSARNSVLYFIFSHSRQYAAINNYYACNALTQLLLKATTAKPCADKLPGVCSRNIYVHVEADIHHNITKKKEGKACNAEKTTGRYEPTLGKYSSSFVISSIVSSNWVTSKNNIYNIHCNSGLYKAFPPCNV